MSEALPVYSQLALGAYRFGFNNNQPALPGPAGLWQDITSSIGEVAQINAEYRISLRRAQQLEQELRSVQARQRNQVLMSPLAGVVQGVAVAGPGAVVNAGHNLMVVVPGDFQPEVEAWLENKDIAYVKPGQAVALKLDAYPFVHYGLVAARVKTISKDAIADEKRGLLYKVMIVPDAGTSTSTQSSAALILTPGMNASAEILTRKRRALDYFLDPIRKTSHEGLRER